MMPFSLTLLAARWLLNSTALEAEQQMTNAEASGLETSTEPALAGKSGAIGRFKGII